MADEQITARPQDSLREQDSGDFAEKQTASQLNRLREARPGALEERDVPNIALDITRPPAKYRPVQLALTFFVLIISLLSCGLGVHVENRFIFGFLLVCFGIAALALCISVGFSLARSLATSKNPTVPEPSRSEAEAP